MSLCGLCFVVTCLCGKSWSSKVVGTETERPSGQLLPEMRLENARERALPQKNSSAASEGFDPDLQVTAPNRARARKSSCGVPGKVFQVPISHPN